MHKLSLTRAWYPGNEQTTPSLQHYQATNLWNAFLLCLFPLLCFPNPRPRLQSNFCCLDPFLALSSLVRLLLFCFLCCSCRSWCFPLFQYFLEFIRYAFLKSLSPNGCDGRGIDEAFFAIIVLLRRGVLRMRRGGGESAPTRRNRDTHASTIKGMHFFIRMYVSCPWYVKYDAGRRTNSLTFLEDVLFHRFCFNRSKAPSLNF